MTREEWEMELTSPLPWQTHRAPTEAQVEAEAAGFFEVLTKTGGEV